MNELEYNFAPSYTCTSLNFEPGLIFPFCLMMMANTSVIHTYIATSYVHKATVYKAQFIILA